MNANDAEEFFPEREVLRARRLRATADEPVQPCEAPTRPTGVWVVWVAVLMPTFVIAITEWNGRLTPRSATIVMVALRLLLAACCALVMVGIWKNIRRTDYPGR